MHDGFIIESSQFGDASTNRFFMRVEFASGPKTPQEEALCHLFGQKVGERFNMEWKLARKSRKTRLLVMVSRLSHCLNDLLHRHSTGQLIVDIPLIVSNHPDLEEIARWHGIPYAHLPIEPHTKREQENTLQKLIGEHAIDTVVLARYMQILSPELCTALCGRIINIHHSFLPSFKGAEPYRQAFDKGVKLIGATAHYVTADLDEGPIIEQEVARVDHSQTPADLAATGRDTECLVLARALKCHIEHRVLLNGTKTVVFR